MTTKINTPTIETTWEVWTYDVWGNAEDGYDVNDRYNVSRDYAIDLTPETYNAGQAAEFVAAFPLGRADP